MANLHHHHDEYDNDNEGDFVANLYIFGVIRHG